MQASSASAGPAEQGGAGAGAEPRLAERPNRHGAEEQKGEEESLEEEEAPFARAMQDVMRGCVERMAEAEAAVDLCTDTAPAVNVIMTEWLQPFAFQGRHVKYRTTARDPRTWVETSGLRVRAPASRLLSSAEEWEVKVYLAEAFAALRSNVWGLSPAQYVHGLYDGGRWKALGSPGRSGSKLFITGGANLLVKTIPHDEDARFVANMDAYARYLREQHAQHNLSLLPKYLGLYRLKNRGHKYFVLVTVAVYPMNRRVFRVYDLKGSTYNRSARLPEAREQQILSAEADSLDLVAERHGTEKADGEAVAPTNDEGAGRNGEDASQILLPAAIFKDQDFLRHALSQAPKEMVQLPQETRVQLLDALRRDSAFLESLDYMDYSLLLVIAPATDADAAGRDGDNNLGGGMSVPPMLAAATLAADGVKPADQPLPLVYFCGVIDILCEYTAKKKAARAFKILTGKPGTQLSTVPSHTYAQRFQAFLAEHVFVVQGT